MFGAVYGDIIGSYYEVHHTKNYNFEFNRNSTFTDDSVLIAAVCKAILNNPSEVSKFGIFARSREYAAQYRHFYSCFKNAGFGVMFAEWAENDFAGNNHSYANGAAMRVIPIGYAYSSLEQIMRKAKASCLSTHNNREAITGAQAVAAAVFLARNGESKESIRRFLQKNFKYNLKKSLKDIKADHVFDSRTSYSVPPAIIAFLDSKDYESAIRGAVSLGGDADTQACIAGGIAEAFYKEIPEHIKNFCYPKIDITIKKVIREFNEKFLHF